MDIREFKKSKEEFEPIKKQNEDNENDILFKAFPRLHITEKTRQVVLKYPKLHGALGVRARMGKIYTDEEWEQKSERVLNTPLPGKVDGTSLVKKRVSTRCQKNK